MTRTIPPPRTRAERIIHWTGIGLTTLLLLGAASVFAYMFWGRSSSSTVAKPNKPLEGTFRSLGPPHEPDLGSWQIEPTSCMDGKERGFEGIIFEFHTGPVREIRVDSSRPNDNIVEIRLAGANSNPHRFHERECNKIAGVIRRSSVVLNGRHMYRLAGSFELDCPEHGLSGTAVFEGCLPRVVKDLGASP